jgi:hypothetical protein
MYCWVFGGDSRFAEIPGERKIVYLVSKERSGTGYLHQIDGMGCVTKPRSSVLSWLADLG